MRSQPILFKLSVFLLTICVAASVLALLHRPIVYAGPETESAFLRNYDPQSVAEAFDSHQFPSHWSHPQSHAAGEAFATHQGRFQRKFAIRPEQWVSLMTALSDDVSTQLSRDGAQILTRTGDPRSGFHFDYKLGKSYGALTISPLEIYENSQSPAWNRTLKRTGTVVVVLNVAFVEKWFPKEPGMITVKVTDRH
jgi:hypothetical protein